MSKDTVFINMLNKKLNAIKSIKKHSKIDKELIKQIEISLNVLNFREQTEAEKRSYANFKERLKGSGKHYPKRQYLEGEVPNLNFKSMAIESR